jgi:uncharacterized surface protein with fasciclin (FAS1) repeats
MTIKTNCRCILLAMSILILNYCTEETQVPKVDPEKPIEIIDPEKQVVSDYINSNPDKFAEFAELVQLTGLKSLLSMSGPYTIMLPNNDAMAAYYKEKGVASLESFDTNFLNNLVRNHLITSKITSGDFSLGALRDTNAIGDYLVTEFQGSDIILNKKSKIIIRDVHLANGYAQIIDKVIDPVTKDCYTVIAEDPSCKIFAEGLEITGIKDTLQISFSYGKQKVSKRFTILAVPDSVYQRNGINTIDNLIKYTGANPDSITYLNNQFYRYMEYHCLKNAYYFNTFKTNLYPVLSSDNNVSMTIDTDYKINLSLKTGKYTAFIVPASNVPAKNGVIHSINGLLPVIHP